LRAGVFVHDVQIGIEQHMLVVDPAYRMRRNEALIQGLWHSILMHFKTTVPTVRNKGD
jgi:hypothetical protein